MADRLRAFCKFLERRSKKNWDNAVLIDGQEGSGKSTLALLIKGFYDGGLNLMHVVYDGNDLLSEMETAPDGSCILVDEGKDAANRRLWYSDLNIALGQALSIIRDKNYLLVVNIPRANELDTHVINRFHYRFWTYTPNKQDRGFVQLYEFVDVPFAKQKRWQRYRFHYRFPQLPEWFEKQYHPFKRENLDKKMREYRERALAKDKKEKRITKRDLVREHLEEHPSDDANAIAKALETDPGYISRLLKSI